jgi:hypothetical protein
MISIYEERYNLAFILTKKRNKISFDWSISLTLISLQKKLKYDIFEFQLT